jgi:hypothetical protein
MGHVIFGAVSVCEWEIRQFVLPPTGYILTYYTGHTRYYYTIVQTWKSSHTPY